MTSEKARERIGHHDLDVDLAQFVREALDPRDLQLPSPENVRVDDDPLVEEA